MQFAALAVDTIAPLSIPSPPPELARLALGPLTIHTYALMIVTGIMVSVWWTNRRMTARGAEPWVIIDIAMPAVLMGLLGARLYHVATHPADYFYEGADLWRVFAIWEGGNAILGALIGGAIGAYAMCRIKGIRFLSFADAAAPTILLAQAIGRLGNWFNHELFGWPTDLPWGLEIEASNPAIPAGIPAGTLFHPTFLYELLWNVLGVGLILLLERMFRMRWGKTVAMYFIWYGIGRMMIESIRLDYSEIVFGLRSNVFGALVLALIGVVLLVLQLRRHHGVETSVYTDGHVWQDTEAKLDAPPQQGDRTAADEHKAPARNDATAVTVETSDANASDTANDSVDADAK